MPAQPANIPLLSSAIAATTIQCLTWSNRSANSSKTSYPPNCALKSDVKQIDGKIDSESSILKAKIDSEGRRLEDKVVSEVGRLEDKVDSGFAQMRTLLENAYLRSELEATRDISNLRERVTRLEVERGAPRQ